MRIILAFTLSLILAISYFVWQPQQFWGGMSALKSSYDQSVDTVMYEKRVEIKGNKRVSEEEIRKLLPMDKSNLWWQTNISEIALMLKKNSIIEEASLTACPSGEKWSCYVVNIVERRPAYVAVLGDRVWLIGKDGGLMSPLDGDGLSSASIQAMAHEIKEAVVVKGLVDENNTPDMIESRIGLLSRALDILESNIKFKVEKVTIYPNAELEISYRGADFKTVLDFERGDLERIDDQSKRLARLLSEYRGRYNQLERIDLAFSKIAVVKLKDLGVATPEKTPLKKVH